MTATAVETPLSTASPRGRFPWLAFVISSLLFLASGAVLGWWVASSGDAAIQPTEEIQQLVDEYFAAFNAYDGETVDALVTDSYLVVEPESFNRDFSVSMELARTADKSQIMVYLQDIYPNENYWWEAVGDPVVSGDGPWLVGQVVRSNKDNLVYPDGLEGMSILTIIDDNGTLKVARDVFMAFGR